ncbi:MAG TPA: hypothetical protein VFC44_22935, partial [Candidatus Saccharimonadales bacterium]|nr:hypothetical protein [Candidatus Saccharimonadales bacterium]
MKTFVSIPKRPSLWAGALAGLLLCALAPASWGANGATQYIDVNDTSGGFGIPSGTVNQTDLSWTTDLTGVAAPVVFTSGDALTFGAVATDLTNATFSVALNQATGQVFNGIIVNATNA